MDHLKKSLMVDSTATDVNEEDNWEKKLRKINCAVGAMMTYVAYVVVNATFIQQMQYVDRSILAQRVDHRSLLMESNSVTSTQECDKEVEHDVDGDSVGTPIHKRQDPKSMSSKVAYKRKHGSTSSEDFQMIKSGMDSIASAISSCAPRVYSTEEILEAVSCVEGLDEDAQLVAYDYLCGDEVRAKAYIGLPLSWRKRWLELKLGGLLYQEIDSRRYTD